MCYRCSMLHDFRLIMGIMNVRETIILIFHSGHTRISRVNPARRLAFFQSSFYLEFDRSCGKGKYGCLPYIDLSLHWKLMCSVPSGDLLGFTPLVERGEHSVFPTAPGHSSLNSQRRKGLQELETHDIVWSDNHTECVFQAASMLLH